MDIITEYTLELLKTETVNVVINKYVMVEGVKTKLGETTSCCYNNCARDRARLESILPENYYNAILDVWGDTPVFSDETIHA